MSLSSGSLDDLNAILEDAGEVVVCGAVTDYGIFDESASFTFSESQSDVQERVTSVLVKTGLFPLITKFGQLITVAGVQYSVRGSSPEDDGHLTRVVIARTNS